MCQRPHPTPLLFLPLVSDLDLTTANLNRNLLAFDLLSPTQVQLLYMHLPVQCRIGTTRHLKCWKRQLLVIEGAVLLRGREGDLEHVVAVGENQNGIRDTRYGSLPSQQHDHDEIIRHRPRSEGPDYRAFLHKALGVVLPNPSQCFREMRQFLDRQQRQADLYKCLKNRDWCVRIPFELEPNLLFFLRQQQRSDRFRTAQCGSRSSRTRFASPVLGRLFSG